MAKEDIVLAGVSAIQQGEVDLYKAQLGVAFDAGDAEGFARGVASVPTGGDPSKIYSQADLDAAVKAKADEDAAADVKLKADFDALVAKEQVEAGVIEKMKALLFP